MPAELAVNWNEIRRAAEAGASLGVLANKYGIAQDTVFKRAARQNWFIPSKVAKAMVQQQRVGQLVRAQGMAALEGLGESSGVSSAGGGESKGKPGETGDGKKYISSSGETLSSAVRKPLLLDPEALEKSLSALDTSALAVEAIRETWETRGDKVRELAWAIGEKSLQGLPARGVMVSDAKDLKTVIGLMRESTGQFKDSPAISLSIFQNEGEEGFSADAPTYEANATVIPASSDDWL